MELDRHRVLQEALHLDILEANGRLDLQERLQLDLAQLNRHRELQQVSHLDLLEVGLHRHRVLGRVSHLNVLEMELDRHRVLQEALHLEANGRLDLQERLQLDLAQLKHLVRKVHIAQTSLANTERRM